MVNTKMFRHPKYYKELRDAGNELAKRNAVKEDLASSGSSPARNKSDQAISLRAHDGERERAPDPGQSIKRQAPSSKQQASSFKRRERQASSDKRQAPSIKAQASSHKRQAP